VRSSARSWPLAVPLMRRRRTGAAFALLSRECGNFSFRTSNSAIDSPNLRASHPTRKCAPTNSDTLAAHQRKIGISSAIATGKWQRIIRRNASPYGPPWRAFGDGDVAVEERLRSKSARRVGLARLTRRAGRTQGESHATNATTGM
jgi:hypothetical protein